MPTETEAALGRLIERYIALCRQQLGSLPMQKHDPEWISPCQVGEPNAQGMIYWQPVERTEAPPLYRRLSGTGRRPAAENRASWRIQTYVKYQTPSRRCDRR